ncbi:MAG: CotH kinase family protein [Dysgonamonadaceae bacterium]|jgi:hypothetical protein|nr:CotH kinase family protein [Dysgonamonadaceae bacterium]
MKKVLLLFMSISFCFNTMSSETITIENGLFGIDLNKKLIVVNQDVESINAGGTQLMEAILIDNQLYTIELPVNSVQVGVAYSIKDSEGKIYKLYFTQLPLIHIATANTIVDEPKVAATFTIAESNSNQFTSDIGIEIRGGVSQWYSKKSYRIEFWTNPAREETKDVSLLGMREDDDWNLQAMYNEPLRIRNKTNVNLWRKINTLYYQTQEADAMNGSRWEYAELFLNGNYHGVYGVCEPIDRKQLKLKKYNETDGIRGELYYGKDWGNGTVTFDKCPSFSNNRSTWDGFEYKYPDEVNPNWRNLYDFVHFVIYSSNETVYSQYSTWFNQENAVDYFIFLNLLRATDNTGKNIFIAKYKANEPYFYVPWDLDGTFGINWTGLHENVTNDLLTNGFYRKLLKDNSINGFNVKVKQKWNQLRNDWLTPSNLIDLFYENYNYLLQNGVYAREQMAWTSYSYNVQDLSYMSDWITKRINYLDRKFNEGTDIKTIQESSSYTDVDVRVYNMSGQIVKFVHLDFVEKDLLLSKLSLPAGIYIVQIQNSNLCEVRKIKI